MFFVDVYLRPFSAGHSCRSMRYISSPPVVPTQVPFENQSRVLTYGILGAVVMRAVFIGLGEAAMSVFQPVLLGFAAILIFSSYKLLSEGEDDEDGDLSDNKLIAFASSALDATDSYDSANFFTVVSYCHRRRGHAHEDVNRSLCSQQTIAAL